MMITLLHIVTYKIRLLKKFGLKRWLLRPGWAISFWCWPVQQVQKFLVWHHEPLHPNQSPYYLQNTCYQKQVWMLKSKF